MPQITWPVNWRDHQIEVELSVDLANHSFRYRLFVDCNLMAEERREGPHRYVTLRGQLQSTSKRSVSVEANLKLDGRSAHCRVFVEGEEVHDSAPDPSVLATPLAELDLSVRCGNCLEAARILTIRDLLRHSEADLLDLRSFGRTSLYEIKRVLHERGLFLGWSSEEEGWHRYY